MVPDVVNSINNFKKPFPKSHLSILNKFFTRDTVHLPALPQFFKYDLEDEVQIDLSTRERRDLSFKWSLHPGM